MKPPPCLFYKIILWYHIKPCNQVNNSVVKSTNPFYSEVLTLITMCLIPLHLWTFFTAYDRYAGNILIVSYIWELQMDCVLEWPISATHKNWSLVPTCTLGMYPRDSKPIAICSEVFCNCATRLWEVFHIVSCWFSSAILILLWCGYSTILCPRSLYMYGSACVCGHVPCVCS